MQNLFERPPVFVVLNINNTILRFWVAHLKPSNATAEMGMFERIVPNRDATIIMGDLNADCNYYKPTKENYFDDWIWLIGNDDDTTTTQFNSYCAFDRIIVTQQANESIVKYGIWRHGVDEKLSNHYPVWVEIRLSM
jgi:endonuclease/exonuclease/phosphatase family metal-dependent hydrolase